jgi:lambda family phage portal protein
MNAAERNLRSIRAAQQLGAPAPATASRVRNSVGYEGASTGRRMSGWQPSTGSVNREIFYSGDILRARSRDALRKNIWAATGIDEHAAHVIGTGITPRFGHPKKKIREKQQKLFDQWTVEADADGLLDFYGLQDLVFRGVREGGEILARLRPRRMDDVDTVPLKIQLLEPEHLPLRDNRTLENNNLVRAGVEFNGIGERVAYHLYKTHPGDAGINATSLDVQRITADVILHMFRPIRPGQVRGEPGLAKALVKLFTMDKYDDATVEACVVASMYAGFITEIDEGDPLPGNTSTSMSDGSENAPVGVEFGEIEPGTFQKLRPGEDMVFTNPPGVGPTYEPFMRQQQRALAKALGIPYHVLTGDLTQISFSSIRADEIAFRRRSQQWQYFCIIHQFCRPVARAWMEAAVLAGHFSAADYAKNKADYLNINWLPAKWDWVDPLKDLQAVILAIRAGLVSRAQAVSELGYDIEEIDAAIARDNERADGLGLVFDTDARRTNAKGQDQSGIGLDTGVIDNPDAVNELVQ